MEDTKIGTLIELFNRPDAVELVEAELIKVMTENPDYVYNRTKHGCLYNAGGNPGCTGCVFGRAFQRLGVPKEKLNFIQSIWNLAQMEGIEIKISSITLNRWMNIQDCQDTGTKWGDLLPLLSS